MKEENSIKILKVWKKLNWNPRNEKLNKPKLKIQLKFLLIERNKLKIEYQGSKIKWRN
jgi:hypothetical protein